MADPASDGFKRQWEAYRQEVDHWLERLLPLESDPPGVIHRAMRYSTLAGGKRLRGVLALAVAAAFGCRLEDRPVPGCALELIHAYSLIHDDLPAMDNDDLRRGKPTSHKVFGEAMAILAGDALLTQAFWLLARHPLGESNALLRCRILEEVALAAGTPAGMIAGQVLDITSGSGPRDLASLAQLHRLKTGALIRCAVRIGAMLGGASGGEMEAVTRFGEELGLAFQITDDMLDVTATREELGKTPGKDAAQDKLTYPGLIGLADSRRRATETVARAIDHLEGLGSGTRPEFLAGVARYVLERSH